MKLAPLTYFMRDQFRLRTKNEPCLLLLAELSEHIIEEYENNVINLFKTIERLIEVAITTLIR